MQAFQLEPDLDPFEYILRIFTAGSYGSLVLTFFLRKLEKAVFEETDLHKD
jgi:hypothetical protein